MSMGTRETGQPPLWIAASDCGQGLDNVNQLPLAMGANAALGALIGALSVTLSF